jgi:hypothetical protein
MFCALASVLHKCTYYDYVFVARGQSMAITCLQSAQICWGGNASTYDGLGGDALRLILEPKKFLRSRVPAPPIGRLDMTRQHVLFHISGRYPLSR